MTVQEQIDLLKKQIENLEKQVAKTPTPRTKVEEFRDLGTQKINEILYGYSETDGSYMTPPINWVGCHELGKIAKENLKYDGQAFIWPYNTVDDLKNNAKQLLTETLERCLSWVENKCLGYDEDENYYYYFSTTCTGHIKVTCRMAFPKSEVTEIENDNLTFEASIEMDGLREW